MKSGRLTRQIALIAGGAAIVGMGALTAGGTVIMATHDLDFAEQVADDIAMMFDGEIACMEPPADFFADNVFYRA